MAKDLFGGDEHDQDDRPVSAGSCTPELLLAYIRESIRATGKQPTLADCKKHFGGIIGAIVSNWELERRGYYVEGRFFDKDAVPAEVSGD